MRQFALALFVCLLAACAAPSPEGVKTDRPAARALSAPDDEAVFHFVVYGDRTGGPADGVEILAQAVAETNLLDPDLVMTVGDLVQGYNQTPLWLEQMREYKGIMDGLAMPWYPVAGNHDVYWRGADAPAGQHENNYEAHFGPLWYWFAHKNAAFIVLYTDEGEAGTNRKGFGDPAVRQMSEAQLDWLAATLRQTAAFEHVFVFLHQPRWIEEYYPENNWKRAHALMTAAGNVSAVFGGHIHRQRYEGERDGILYYTLATVGGAMPMDLPGTGWANHMDMVTVRRETFEIASLPVGSVYDPAAMTPAYLADIDRARNPPFTPPTGSLVLGRDGAAKGRLTYRIENKSEQAIAFSFEPRAPGGGGWSFQPLRVAARLAPGEARDVAFVFERQADGLAAPLSVPEMVRELDARGGAKPVTLPTRVRPVPLQPETIDPEAWPLEGDQVVRLDGQGAGLWFPSTTTRPPEGPLTLETWFRPEELGRDQALFGKTDESGFALVLLRGRPAALVHVGGGYKVARDERQTPFELGRWYHLAAVHDGKELRLYLDGQLVGTSEAKGWIKHNDMPLIVGAEPGDDGRPVFAFKGALDEVRLSTTVRYNGEGFTPERRHAPDPATFLLLHMDRPSAPFAFDSSGARRHGLGLGAVAFEPRAGGS